MTPSLSAKSSQQGPVAWWRVPVVWMVIGGPALVVVAGVTTLVIAFKGADIPLREATTASTGSSLAPATQARNHAAAPRR